MRTSVMFINEYSLSDSVIECAEEVVASVMSAAWDYENHKRDIELRAVLESADTTAVLLEKEGQGFLASVGNAIMTLIHKVEEFLKKITDVLFGSLKKNKDEVEIVTKLITQYPELRKTVCKGLSEDWFTYKDIAAYEKDVCGLIQMLEKHTIDHQTFKDRIKNAMDRFNDSAQPLASAVKNIEDLVDFIPRVHKGATESKEAVKSFRDMLKKFKKDVDHNYAIQGANAIKSVFNALGQAVGLCSKECEHRVKCTSKLGKFISKINNSKLATRLKLDDASRNARHQNSYYKNLNDETRIDLEKRYAETKEALKKANNALSVYLDRDGKRGTDEDNKLFRNVSDLEREQKELRKRLASKSYEQKP